MFSNLLDATPKEIISQISFGDSKIIPKLIRAKAKLKFINVTQKLYYERNLGNINSKISFSLENEEEAKVFF